MTAAPRAPRSPLATGMLLVALLLLAGRALAGPVDDAKKALAAKKYAAAAEALADLVDKDAAGTQREAALLFVSAVVKGRLSDHYRLAEDAVSRLVKKAEADPELRTALGEVFLAQAPGCSDPKAIEATYRDALDQFDKALAAAPGSPAATVGKAQAHYYAGDFDAALEALDAVPADKPSAAVQYWRGKIFYDRAVQAYAADPKAEATQALFKKAKGASEASAHLDATSFDTWMQLAYASQYLGEAGTALEAYTKAAGLESESPYPIKGVAALKTGDDAGYVAALETLIQQVPTNVIVHYYLGRAHLAANRWEKAAAALTAFTQRSANPGAGFTALGQALAGAGKEKEAVAAFEKALAKNPKDLFAADEIDQRFRRKYQETALEDLKAAKECLDDYERLASMTQDNAFVLNNGAFLLREAFTRHKGQGAWLPILKGSVALYEKAAKIVDDTPEDVVGQASWGDRYAWAQITSDTGLMYQFYPEVEDAKKAETYYLRALKLTNTGYFDAWNNLRKLYHQQGAFQKVYDLDARAAEGLALESGEPHGTGRKEARAEMERLVSEGKAKAD